MAASMAASALFSLLSSGSLGRHSISLYDGDVSRHGSSQGLELGPTDVLLHVRPCEGLIRQLDGTIEKRFAKTELAMPLQVKTLFSAMF